MLRQELSCGEAVDADRLHAMGRLYQRLGVFARERAYLASYVWMLNGLLPATTLLCWLFMNFSLPGRTNG